MIANPHNDRACLDAITAEIIAKVAGEDPALVALASQLPDTDAAVEYIRSLPQLDDTGSPCDGPKVDACKPAQRLRLPAEDPNCVERSALYLALAELIDPEPVRRLATVNTPNGLHTFPTEDGVPVILDPGQSRNALRAGLFRMGRNGFGPLRHQPAYRRRRQEERLTGLRADLERVRAAKAAGQTTWEGRAIDDAIATHEKRVTVAEGVLAEIPRNTDTATRRLRIERLIGTDETKGIRGDLAARFKNGTRRVRNGHRAMRAALVGRPLCVADVGDVAFVLALADREARLWGAPGQRVVRTCAQAIDRLDQASARTWLDERAPRNAAELRLGHYRVRPNTPLLAALGRVGLRLGGNVATQGLRVKLATMGVSPGVLSSLEGELNREGLSLGPLAAPPPMLGSLAALTPDAIAGRWLASRI